MARLLLAAAAAAAASATRFELAAVHGDGMVLQRDTDGGVVWGFASADLAGAPVYGSLVDTVTGAAWALQGAVDAASGVWRLRLPRRPGAPSPYALYVSTAPGPGPYVFDGVTLVMSDVVFGDVLFAGGQSNMELPVRAAFNATAEAAAADAVGGAVRLFQAAPSVASAAAPLEQLARVAVPWSVASGAAVGPFSAAAWFTAKALLAGRTGADAAVPLGVVVSSWGGTGIRAWQGAAGNAACMPLYPYGNGSGLPQRDCANSDYHAPCNDSAIANALVAPFTVGPMPVASFVWYQGENDANPEEVASGYYACQLAALAAGWRAGFGSPNATWSTVQLAPWDQAAGPTLAAFRAAQADATAGGIPRSHTAVLVDDGDATSPYGHVHSRNKQLAGDRVARGLLALLYGYNASVAPLAGPTFAGATYGAAAATPAGLLALNVSFAPGTVGPAGLAWVPPAVSPWSNSSRCPAELPGFANPASCGWFTIVGTDGGAYNVTHVALIGSGDGSGLALTAAGVPPGVRAAGSRYGWADWPVVNVYAARGWLPVVPWCDAPGGVGGGCSAAAAPAAAAAGSG